MENSVSSRIREVPKLDSNNIICKYPKNMLLELTNCCNNSCLFCAHSKCTKKRGFIKPETAKKVLKEAYLLGTREVGFYGTGEPLLDNNLEEYISYAKALGYEYIYITTNGALFTEDRIKSIVDAGIDSIKFSINASNKKDYLMIHGKDEFEKVINNLIHLDNYRKKNGNNMKLYISYVATRHTNYEIDEFKDKYIKYVDDIAFFDCRNIAGCMANEIIKYLSVDEKIGYHPDNGICSIIFKVFYVTYEGYLTMCCADFQNYLVIADLNKDALADAWNNQYAQELRKRHLEHKLEGTLCYNCINDCVSDIKPIREEYAVVIDSQNWDKCEEICRRIANNK